MREERTMTAWAVAMGAWVRWMGGPEDAGRALGVTRKSVHRYVTGYLPRKASRVGHLTLADVERITGGVVKQDLARLPPDAVEVRFDRAKESFPGGVELLSVERVERRGKS